MKKKFLGALIALGGSIAAVGTAFALYTGSLPEDKTIQIGTKTTGDVALNASVVENDSAHTVLTPSSKERLIKFNAGFTTNDSSVYIQDYYLAKLEFKISSTSAALIERMDESSWVKLGTQTGENAYGTWWGWDMTIENPDLRYTERNHMNGTSAHLAEDHKSVTWTTHYPLFKGSNISEFEFHVRLDDAVNDEIYASIAEETYKVDFTVSEPDSDFEMAYIVGLATGGWEKKDEYRMTVNAKASSFEWMFKTGATNSGKSELEDGKTYKLVKDGTPDDIYCCGDADHVWSAANNGKTFYWDGGNASHGDLFN